MKRSRVLMRVICCIGIALLAMQPALALEPSESIERLVKEVLSDDGFTGDQIIQMSEGDFVRDLLDERAKGFKDGALLGIEYRERLIAENLELAEKVNQANSRMWWGISASVISVVVIGGGIMAGVMVGR